MSDKEKQAWDTILAVAEQLPAEAAAFLQGYAQGMADSNAARAEAKEESL